MIVMDQQLLAVRLDALNSDAPFAILMDDHPEPSPFWVEFRREMRGAASVKVGHRSFEKLAAFRCFPDQDAMARWGAVSASPTGELNIRFQRGAVWPLVRNGDWRGGAGCDAKQ